MRKPRTNEDRHLEQLREQHFPRSRDRRWPTSGGAGWFKAPRPIPVLLQILTEKKVVSRGNPGLAYLELLSRVREPGFIVLDHPADHARIIGYARTRTWSDAMQQLSDLGFIETKKSHNREFAYALMVNPFIAVRRLHTQERISDALWDLFFEKWTKAGADVPDDDDPVEAPASAKPGARAKKGKSFAERLAQRRKGA
jgi:hypothetical protein